jgi:hypothetical protein
MPCRRVRHLDVTATFACCESERSLRLQTKSRKIVLANDLAARRILSFVMVDITGLLAQGRAAPISRRPRRLPTLGNLK